MSSIGYATLSVIPSLRGLDRNVLAQLNGQAGRAGAESGQRFGDEFSRRASKSVSGIGSKLAAVAKGAGYVTLAALGTGAALATIGVKSAASLEQTRVAFTSLLGSTKAANQQIAQLQKFAAKTPFSQSDVLGYSQQYFALANTVGLAKDQVIPFLRTIGDVASVTGASTENIHNAVMAIGQIGSAGKVTLENLNQISEAFPGFNGAAAIAAATGQKTADVMKQISAGEISATEGIPALLKGMKQFQGASGAMAKQSKTLNGLFSTFGDTIKIKLTNAFQPLIPVVKNTLSQLTPVIGQTLQNLAPAIASFTKNLAPVLTPLTQGLGQALGAVFSVLGPVLANLAPLIKPLANAFAHLVTAAQPLIVFLSKIVAELGPPLIGIFNELVSAVAPVVRELAQALAPVLPIIAATLRRLMVALRPVIHALAGAFLTVLKAIAPDLPGLAQAFGDLAVAVAELIVPFTPLIKLFGALIGLLSKGVIKYLEAAAKWIKIEINAIKDLLGWIGKITGLGSGISNSISLFSNAVTNATGNVVGSLPQMTSAFGGVQSSVDGLSNSIGFAKSQTATMQQAINSLHGGTVTLDADTTDFGRKLRAIGGIAAIIPGFLGVGVGIALDAAAIVLGAAASAGATPGPNIGGGGVDTGGGGGGGGGPTPSAKPPKPGKFDKSTLAGLRKALTGDAPGIKAAIQSIEQSLRQAKKAIPAYVAGEATQLEKWARARTAVVAKLTKATSALQNIQGKYNSLLTSVRDATVSSFDITTAGAHAQVFNDRAAAPTTAGSILAALKRKVANSQKFDSVLRKLRKEGMPAALVQQLALAGPDALAQAQALAKSTPKQIAQFQTSYKTLKSTATDLGTFLAKDAFGAGVKTAQGLVDGLKSKRSHLTKEIEHLGKALINQLKKTLKISSPSRVMFELGGHTAEGFRLGIASGYAGVGRAGAGLGSAASSSGRHGYASDNRTVHNHWNITEQHDPVGTATAVIRRMQLLGA